MGFGVSTWASSRKERDRLQHALNGNSATSLPCLLVLLVKIWFCRVQRRTCCDFPAGFPTGASARGDRCQLPASVNERSRISVVVAFKSSARGTGCKIVVPKLVDEAEDHTEVTPLATANSSQCLVEDADGDDVVDPAASLVQMLKEPSRCLCARFRRLPQSKPRKWVLRTLSCHIGSPDCLPYCVHAELSMAKESNWSSTSNMITYPA